MWIEAILSVEDLRRTLHQLAPLTIRLGEGQGELALEAPSEVSLVADQGVRIVCVAHLHWPVLGFDVPVTMKSLEILLRPVIEGSAEGDALVFKLEIEHADLAYVPTGIDNRITARINAELARKHVELTWRYPGTLDHVFGLPDMLSPAESLVLVVTSGLVKVTPEAMGLAVSLRCDVVRHGELTALQTQTAKTHGVGRAGDLVAREPDGALPVLRRPPHALSFLFSPAALAGGLAALALGLAFGLGRVTARRRRWASGLLA